MLLGEGFCKNKEMGFNPDQVTACIIYVHTFVPVAVQNLMINAEHASAAMCNDLFNVCIADTLIVKK